ncbi:MAG: NADH-quinone oxidoreductase subunit M [Bacteroidetes bacterium]|nr:NADH-quinone oxidoreductase subunit M [Bacteroidota bacterium]
MVLLIFPLIASALLYFLKDKTARIASLILSLVQLVINAYIFNGFDFKTDAIQFYNSYKWFDSIGLNFTTGIDGISMVMLLLTNIATFLITLSSWDNKYFKINSFLSLIFLMQAALNGVFISQNGLLFYIFWELALIPIYFITGIWGGENRIKITFKFFIYTFLGSLLMLVAFIYIYLKTTGVNAFEWENFINTNLSNKESTFLLWAFFIAFAIKMPVFPFHTWQPDTYSVAPSQGTMLLSGIMLKMGIFGMIKWMFPLLKNTCNCNINIFMILAVAGIVYAAIIAIMQKDIKRVIAWSSISHVGLIAAGILTLSEKGLQGGVLQMFNHGINIIGLFFVVEIIERRINTRKLEEMGGLAQYARGFSVLFMIIMLGSIALPLTNGFTGEFLLLNAVFNYCKVWGVVSALTIIFCAVYMLRVYQLSMFGEPKSSNSIFGKLSWSEYITLGIIVCIVILTGIFPNTILNISEVSVKSILTILE